MKYEKPEVIDFKWAEAMGACTPGSGDATHCYSDGNNAGGFCDSNGQVATSSCSLGNGY